MKTFTAHYRGKCIECLEGIEVGDELTYVDGDLMHAECAPAEEDALW